MKILKKISIFFIIILMLALTGCWNYREIESMSIVSGVAIDKGENGYKYHMTIQYVNLSGGSKSSPKPMLAETDGNTIFDAVRNVLKQSPKKFYFSDCKIAIISSQLANEGISPLLDLFIRDSEPRITIDLLVSKEEKAGDILKQKEGSDEISAFSINKIIDFSPRFVGKSPNVAIYQTENLLYGKGISLVLPAIKMETSEKDKKPVLDGAAIFKKDKLLGFINDSDSQFMLFAQDKYKGGLLLVNVNSDEINTTLEIIKSTTTVSFDIINGLPLMKIKIKADAVMAEENSSENNVEKLGLKEIEKSANKTIENGVTNIINIIQTQYNSDIFGFGNTIYQNNPKYWNKISSDWDSIFNQLNYTVTANVKIKNTAVANPKKVE